MVVATESLHQLSEHELRSAVSDLLKTVAARDQQLIFKQATIDKLTHENAILKRLKFAAQSERFSADQRSLLEETLDADLQTVSDELDKLSGANHPPAQDKHKPKRQVLPANLPRTEIHHEPASTTCTCGCQMKRIGEDVSEKLDYVPGVFSVERQFFDLHASSKSQIAQSALEQIGKVYDIEREIKELLPEERRRIRRERSKPLLDALHQWLLLNRQKITPGSATAKALDYSLKRWAALTRFVGDGQLPVDNNHIENQIRPIAMACS